MNHALGFLEDERLSYLGFSYGTVLGATFAALYPEKIDRMVLDGVVDDRQYYDAEKDPAFDVGDIDEALQICFEACHDAGPEACAFWHNNADEIRRSCFEADRILQSRPHVQASRVRKNCCFRGRGHSSRRCLTSHGRCSPGSLQCS